MTEGPEEGSLRPPPTHTHHDITDKVTEGLEKSKGEFWIFGARNKVLENIQYLLPLSRQLLLVMNVWGQCVEKGFWVLIRNVCSDRLVRSVKGTRGGVYGVCASPTQSSIFLSHTGKLSICKAFPRIMGQVSGRVRTHVSFLPASPF